MIIELIMSAVSAVLKLLFAWINLPAASPEISAAFADFLTYVESGVSFLAYFLPMDLVKVMISVFLLVFAFEHGYWIVMWIIKKIPALGIK